MSCISASPGSSLEPSIDVSCVRETRSSGPGAVLVEFMTAATIIMKRVEIWKETDEEGGNGL